MENVMGRMIVSKDPKHFRDFLEKTVIIVGGEVVDNNSIDLNDDTPVAIAIVVNVNGIGRHPGAISAGQGDHPDAALEAAHEILEEWEREHYGDISTETFDGQTWELSAEDFANAIEGTDAAKHFDDDIVGDEEEIGEVTEDRVSEPNDARDILEGLGKHMTHEGHDAPRESARIARMIAGVRGDADKADKVLEEVDRLVNGNGIEPIRDENANDRYYGDVVALYVNMGDTYETTLLYDTEAHEFLVTSWGDWFEAYEAERDEAEDDEEPEEDEDDEEEDE